MFLSIISCNKHHLQKPRLRVHEGGGMGAGKSDLAQKISSAKPLRTQTPPFFCSFRVQSSRTRGRCMAARVFSSSCRRAGSLWRTVATVRNSHSHSTHLKSECACFFPTDTLVTLIGAHLRVCSGTVAKMADYRGSLPALDLLRCL